MVFRHAIRNMEYVIRPRSFKVEWGVRQNVRGINVRFTNHIFDSLNAQGVNGWSDEERKEVEGYLRNHPDFGRPWSDGRGGLWPAEGEELPDRQEVAPDRGIAAEPEMRCIFTIATPEGTEQCARKAKKNEDYCAEHLKDIAKAER